MLNARLHMIAAVLPWMFAAAVCAEAPRNFFSNPGFELGHEGWEASKAGGTECRFAVDGQDAVDGQCSALLTIGATADWGVQFGQAFPAGSKGRTYTFAAHARSMKGPARVDLQIERRGPPYDRMAAGSTAALSEAWQEIHLTFTPDKDYPEGWFAYLSCRQPNVQIRADAFRLYEGTYVPFAQFAQEEAAATGVRLFDTITAARGPAFGDRAGWKAIPEDKLAHAFSGDAVFMNNRILCTLRRGACGAELYAQGGDGMIRRAVLIPVTDNATTGTLASFAIQANNPGAVAMKAEFKTPTGNYFSWRCELKMGQPFVETQAAGGTAGLRVEAPCRFAVMPDFFADDIAIDAAELPVAAADLPSDNILLHLAPDGAGIVMTVTKTSEEDIHVRLDGQGAERVIESSELRYDKNDPIWVGVLSAPGIWHKEEITPEQAGQILPMKWKPPFPANWRVDWRREGNLTDSWEMILEQADGNFAKYGLAGPPDTLPPNRSRWTTVLGRFPYPAWIDRGGKALLQPIKSEALRLAGPALIYPIGRAPDTGLDDFTVIDLLRNTLGIGPCEYVLDVEGRQSALKGRATCAVRDTLNPIYEARQQKQRRAEIEKTLEDLMTFVRHIRGRIECYIAFEQEILDYLSGQRRAHPELAAPIEEMERLARTIGVQYAARKDSIKTPEHVAGLIAEFRATVLNDDSAAALEHCKKFTAAWVEIGGNQDELVGECRWAVKLLRQRAGLLLATEPKMADVAKEIRKRSQAVLRNPSVHESAAH